MHVLPYAASAHRYDEIQMPLFKRTLSEPIFRRFMLKHYASNLLVDMNLEAKKSTLEYIKANMVDAPYFENQPQLVNYALSQVRKDGLTLEFGVGRGNPIGSFAQKKMAKVPDNVEFQEFVERSGVTYEYIAFSVTGQQVAVRILENPGYAG